MSVTFLSKTTKSKKEIEALKKLNEVKTPKRKMLRKGEKIVKIKTNKPVPNPNVKTFKIIKHNKNNPLTNPKIEVVKKVIKINDEEPIISFNEYQQALLVIQNYHVQEAKRKAVNLSSPNMKLNLMTDLSIRTKNNIVSYFKTHHDKQLTMADLVSFDATWLNLIDLDVIKIQRNFGAKCLHELSVYINKHLVI